MYIPNINRATDKAEILAFMQRYSFATIITSKDNYPTATHLPFVVSIKDDQVILTSHFAKANEQWQDIEGNPVLVIFSEPHAYISPQHYEKELNVPTWNYISVHAYGQAQLLTEPEQAFAVLGKTIDTYESAYRQQWEQLPDDFKQKMVKGIVAFEIKVQDLQAKKKLSQNRSGTEQRRIVDSLSKSADTNEQVIGEYMKRNLPDE